MNNNNIHIYRRCYQLEQDQDISGLRQALRELLKEIDFNNEIKTVQIYTILDELGKNILRHGKRGEICISAYLLNDRIGFRIISEDQGKGIKDLDKALRPGYSEDNGMGMGLNLLLSLADDVRIANLLDGGTYIEVWKWI